MNLLCPFSWLCFTCVVSRAQVALPCLTSKTWPPDRFRECPSSSLSLLKLSGRSAGRPSPQHGRLLCAHRPVSPPDWELLEDLHFVLLVFVTVVTGTEPGPWHLLQDSLLFLGRGSQDLAIILGVDLTFSKVQCLLQWWFCFGFFPP